MRKDIIYRQDAIEALRKEWDGAMVAGITASEILSDSEDAINRVPSAQPEPDMTTHIISETLHECGIYGEEATITMISVLKRLGRSDLLLPCMR